MLKALGQSQEGDTYIQKAFSERFGFDALRTSQPPKLSVKAKATGTPLGGVFSYAHHIGGTIIFTSAWGFQRCSVGRTG